MALVFGSIHPVPEDSKTLIDTVLSATNRRTATIVHPGFKISRIRDFYMQKVEFTQSEFHNRLTQILEDFPRLDSIHPFWSSLINVVYDRDHYKLALGQIVGARSLVDNIGRDFVKYLKYGDSLFRCKQLKKSALGRMCTACKRLTPSLQYLEQVRQHLQRMPSIDPAAPTIILAGMPSTGKSSFMNAITRANVEVAPYAFTTKSLYLGHTDFEYLTWQVIDTPGLLDRPLEERNTIEMTSIMAMVHLRAAIIFMLDISGTCGSTIEEQVSLFRSLAEIFNARPITVVLTKVDIIQPEQLPPEEQALIHSLEGPNVNVQVMSSLTGEGVNEVKCSVCARLRSMRVEAKRTSDKLLKVESRLHVAVPSETLEPNIPPGALEPQGLGRPLQRELEVEAGGAGAYIPNTHAERLLADDSWRDDIMPEIMEGRNIADYIDPDINRKFEELLQEEAVRYAAYQQEKQNFEENKWRVTPDQEEIVRKIRERKAIIKEKAQQGHTGRVSMPESSKAKTRKEVAEKVSQYLEDRGVDEDTRRAAIEKVMSEKPKRVKRNLEPKPMSKGKERRGEGERFDFYVKKNWVLEPKHMFTGKTGFKRDWK